MLEMEIDSLRIIPGYQHWAVVLKEKSADRYLPIFVSLAEADAMAVKLRGLSVTWPLTHDVLHTVINALGGSVKYVVVNGVHNCVAYAKIVIQVKGDVKEFDSHPGDAIVLAVQSGVPIYTEEWILKQSAWPLDQESDLFISLEQNPQHSLQGTTAVKEEELQRLTAFTELINTLEEELQRLTAFTELINTLELEDLGTHRQNI